MTPAPDQLREFARRYTDAWCSQDPTRVAEHYAPEGSLTINEGPPSMTLEMQRGGNAAILSVCAFPQLNRLIDQCIAGSSKEDDNTPPTRNPFDFYDAEVWWKIDVSSIEAPSTHCCPSAD
jgi:hypothetical protein